MTAAQNFPVMQFQHPRLTIPPPLMMSEPGSFAHLTLTERWPAIAQRVVAENSFSAEIANRVEGLVQELSEGSVRSIKDDGPDLNEWATDLEPFIGKPWIEVPCFFAEVYFYRRLLEAVQYFRSGQEGTDPFLVQKQRGLESALGDIRAMSDTISGDLGSEMSAEQRLISLLYSGLWGNRADLSLRPTLATEQVQQDLADQMEQTHILVDDTPKLLDRIHNQSLSRVDLIADNAGFELVCDLFLIDFLLMNEISQAVHLHLKFHPTFVSDATIADVHQTLEVLANDGDAIVNALAARLRSYLADDRLKLSANPFWTAPLVFWQMPQTLQQELSQSDLVVIKGDANYRRLLGDCHWSFTELFQDICCYFPASFVALRTLKSEIVAGLQQSQVDQLNQSDQDWLTTGHWGVIQFVEVSQ